MDRLRGAPFHHGNLEVLENGPSGVISFPLCFVNVSWGRGAAVRPRQDRFELLSGV